MKTLRTVEFTILLITLLFWIAVPVFAGPSGQGQSQDWTAHVVNLLEKSGYEYTKIDKGVWEIQFKGKNIPQFPVRIVVADDLVLAISKLSDPKALKQTDKLFQKLLQLNDKMDSVKFALSDEMLYVRMETHARLLDEQELKYMLDQMSAAVDQAYPDIKDFIPAAKQ